MVYENKIKLHQWYTVKSIPVLAPWYAMVNENKTALVMYCRIKNFELLQKRRFRVVESSAGQKTPKIVKKRGSKKKICFCCCFLVWVWITTTLIMYSKELDCLS